MKSVPVFPCWARWKSRAEEFQEWKEMVSVHVLLVTLFSSLGCSLCSTSVWEPAQLFGNPNITCYAMSGTGAFGIMGTAGDGLLRTEDHGATFINTTSETGMWNSVAMNLNGEYAVATGDSSISLSRYFGVVWAPGTASFLSAHTALSDSGQYVYIASQYLWTSSDRGETFTKFDLFADAWKAIKTESTGQYGIAISPSNIVYSTNYGLSWMQGVLSARTGMTPGFLSLAMSSYLNIAYVGADDGWVYMTIDYGATWDPLSAINADPSPVYSLACDGDGGRILAGSDLVYERSGYDKEWTTTQLPPANSWTALSMSRDGEYATALMDDGTGNRTLYYSAPIPVIDYDDDDLASGSVTTTLIVVICSVVGGMAFLGVCVWLLVRCIRTRGVRLGKR
jgi:hypothetical protein